MKWEIEDMGMIVLDTNQVGAKRDDADSSSDSNDDTHSRHTETSTSTDEEEMGR